MPPTTPLSRGAMLAAVGLFFATSAQASLLVYEGFDYSSLNAADTLVASNGGTGFTAAWAQGTTSNNNASLPLTYNTTSLSSGLSTQLATVGGSASDADASIRAIERTFTPVDITGNGSLWFSFLVQPNTTAGNINFSLGDGTASNNSANGSGIRLTLNGVNSVAGLGTTSGTTFTTALGTTYLIVGQFTYSDSSDDTLSVWVNPTTSTLGTANSVVSTANATFTVNTLLLHSLGSARTFFDEVRVGTAQSDVMLVSSVPEPSTVALLAGLGALGFAARRRRSA